MGNQNNKKYQDKKYIWIDPNIENEENKCHYLNIFKKRDINCKKFDNLDEAYSYLIENENTYTEIIIIISGKLFNDLYKKIKNYIIKINFIPNIIVFTSKKEEFINNLKMNNLYYNNNKLFDIKLIFTKESQISNYIDGIIEERYDLTFDIIENLDQLIIPNYYSYLFEDANDFDIKSFNNFLKKNFKSTTYKNCIKGNEILHELANKLKSPNIHNSTILKYWLRIYSLESDFYKEMNKSLRNMDEESYNYFPFIKLCYEGIKKGYINPYNHELYRFSKMTKREFENIQNKLNLNSQKQYPGIIAFSKSFLSFSMDKDCIQNFKGADKNTYCILYIIEEIKDIKNIQNIISNVIMAGKSVIEKEKEVLIFPFSCFEIVDIKKINLDKIDYEIHLKYLGNYSQLIKDQFGKNFFENIQISTFSQELIDCGALKIHNFYSKWEKTEEIYNIKVDKICFFLGGEQDIICISNNDIIVFDIYSFKIKQKITVHQEKILDLYKLSSNRICTCSEDKTFKIIELKENNTKYIERYNQSLGSRYSIQINFFNNGDLYFIDNSNDIAFFTFQGNVYKYKGRIQEKDKILKTEKLDNGKIVYIIENQEGNKFINFINIREIKREENYIQIEEKEQKLKFIDLLVFYDYIIIGYNHRIDIINYQNNPYKIKSLKYFTFEITNIAKLSSNRIIIGTYDSNKKESTIREHLLRIEDLQNNINNIDKFDCLGFGELENKIIENIVKINESQILINVKNDSCFIYKRSNEISDALRKKIMKFDEGNKNKIRYLNTKEEEKNNINNDITPMCSKLMNTPIFEKKTIIKK